MPSGVKDIQLLELKDTISQLNKTISTQNELISSLQKMLEERNAKDSEKDLLIANLQSQLAYLKNKVFGSTSEIRHDQLDGQLNLFGTPVGDEKPAEVIEPEVISVKGYTKERKPKATYDDKYNSVRSICKHFFTDIVGLSIKFFCVSLRHMSINPRNVALIVFWIFSRWSAPRSPLGNPIHICPAPILRYLIWLFFYRDKCLCQFFFWRQFFCSFFASCHLTPLGFPELSALLPRSSRGQRLLPAVQ